MRRVLAVIALLVTVALFAFGSIEVRHDMTWVDSIAGSTKRQTTWRYGTTSEPVIERSPIAMRLERIGEGWVPRWQALGVRGRTVYGSRTSIGCSTAPPIYGLWSLQRHFIGGSSDDEVREFVRIMQEGSEEEQRKAVDTAADIALRSLTSSQ